MFFLNLTKTAIRARAFISTLFVKDNKMLVFDVLVSLFFYFKSVFYAPKLTPIMVIIGYRAISEQKRH